MPLTGKRYKEYQKKYRRAHHTKLKSYDRARYYRRTHKLEIAQAEELLRAQNGICVLCGLQLKLFGTRHSPSSACVDHDHATGRMRSILCRACNTGLGLFRESSALLRKAASYIEEHDGKEFSLG